MGTSWISKKWTILEKGGGVDLENGGYEPLTNYGTMFFNVYTKSHIFKKKTWQSRHVKFVALQKLILFKIILLQMYELDPKLSDF